MSCGTLGTPSLRYHSRNGVLRIPFASVCYMPQVLDRVKLGFLSTEVFSSGRYTAQITTSRIGCCQSITGSNSTAVFNFTFVEKLVRIYGSADKLETIKEIQSPPGTECAFALLSNSFTQTMFFQCVLLLLTIHFMRSFPHDRFV